MQSKVDFLNTLPSEPKTPIETEGKNLDHLKLFGPRSLKKHRSQNKKGKSIDIGISSHNTSQTSITGLHEPEKLILKEIIKGVLQNKLQKEDLLYSQSTNKVKNFHLDIDKNTKFPSSLNSTPKSLLRNKTKEKDPSPLHNRRKCASTKNLVNVNLQIKRIPIQIPNTETFQNETSMLETGGNTSIPELRLLNLDEEKKDRSKKTTEDETLNTIPNEYKRLFKTIFLDSEENYARTLFTNPQSPVPVSLSPNNSNILKRTLTTPSPISFNIPKRLSEHDKRLINARNFHQKVIARPKSRSTKNSISITPPNYWENLFQTKQQK